MARRSSSSSSRRPLARAARRAPTRRSPTARRCRSRTRPARGAPETARAPSQERAELQKQVRAREGRGGACSPRLAWTASAERGGGRERQALHEVVRCAARARGDDRLAHREEPRPRRQAERAAGCVLDDSETEKELADDKPSSRRAEQAILALDEAARRRRARRDRAAALQGAVSRTRDDHR